MREKDKTTNVVSEREKNFTGIRPAMIATVRLPLFINNLKKKYK